MLIIPFGPGRVRVDRGWLDLSLVGPDRQREDAGSPDIPPIDVDGVRTMEIGTLLWLIGFLALLPFYSRLADDGHTWWLWTCLAGFGLGALGIEWCRQMRRKRLER